MPDHNAAETSATATTPERDPRLDRLSALSDGVYAIALTLLAVELGLPEAAADLHGRALLESLLESWPKVFGFLASFTVIAIFWVANAHFYQQVWRLDGKLLWFAMLKLGCVAFVPFPTAVLGEHVSDPVAQPFYFASLLMAGSASAAVCWYATSGGRLMAPGLAPHVIRHYRLLIGAVVPASFLLLMALTAVGIGRLVNPVVLAYLVTLGYVLVVAYEWWEPREAGPRTAGQAKPGAMLRGATGEPPPPRVRSSEVPTQAPRLSERS